MLDIYKYDDYKKFLVDTAQSVGSRGYKAALAEAAGCQRSFLSQALNGAVHLTSEHAVGISKFLNLSESETLYFESMVGCARSSSKSTKAIYLERMRKLKIDRKNLAKRFETKELQITDLSFSEYYSDAIFSVVHLLLTIPQLRTVEALATRLRTPTNTLHDILKKLQLWGLAENTKNLWNTTQKQVHIPREHPMAQVHHRNFRELVSQHAMFGADTNVRYSAIYTLSENDAETLRLMTVDFVEQTRKLVYSSQEQGAVIFNLDLVKI